MKFKIIPPKDMPHGLSKPFEKEFKSYKELEIWMNYQNSWYHREIDPLNERLNFPAQRLE